MTYSAINAEKDALIASLRNRIIELEKERKLTVELCVEQLVSAQDKLSSAPTDNDTMKRFYTQDVLAECIRKIREFWYVE